MKGLAYVDSNIFLYSVLYSKEVNPKVEKPVRFVCLADWELKGW